MAHVRDLWHKVVDGKKVRTDRYGTDGKRWMTTWVEPDGTRRSQTYRTKDAAEEKRTDVDQDIRSGNYVNPKAGRATIESIWPDWWATKATRTPKTLEGYAGIWRTHVQPKWGSRPVASVKGHEVARWMGELQAAGMSGSQAHKVLLVMQGLMKTAVSMKLLPASPLVEVEKPRPAEVPKRFLTVDQVSDLARRSAMPEEVWLLATCGLRRGEMFALRVGDLDERRRRLHVHRGVTWAQGEVHEGETKGHRARDVPVPASVMTMLQERVKGRPKSDLMFTDPQGRQWTPTTWRQAWLRSLGTTRGKKRAATPGPDAFDVPDLDTHELRHTAVSLAIQSGANVKAVQRMVGHRDASMTLNIYGHLWDDHLDDVSARMDAMVADAVKTSRRTAGEQEPEPGSRPESEPVSRNE